MTISVVLPHVRTLSPRNELEAIWQAEHIQKHDVECVFVSVYVCVCGRKV